MSAIENTSVFHSVSMPSLFIRSDHFDSPADVIAQLHEHERVEFVNHNAWNEILHALVTAIVDRTTEEVGQQFLAAYAPAIHKVYREGAKNSRGCVQRMSRNRRHCASWKPRDHRRCTA